MAEFQLEIWRPDLGEYTRAATGDDPRRLVERYKASQWIDNAAWFAAWPGASRAHRVVRTDAERPLKPPRVRTRVPRSTRDSCPIEHQAERYARHLVATYGKQDVPVRYWKHRGNGHAKTALVELCKALEELGATWTLVALSWEEQHAVEESEDDDDQVNGLQEVRVTTPHVRASNRQGYDNALAKWELWRAGVAV